MHGAVQFVEQQKGGIAGTVVIVMEGNESAAKYRQIYKCVTAIQPSTKRQHQATTQYVKSFRKYNSEVDFSK